MAKLEDLQYPLDWSGLPVDVIEGFVRKAREVIDGERGEVTKERLELYLSDALDNIEWLIKLGRRIASQIPVDIQNPKE